MKKIIITIGTLAVPLYISADVVHRASVSLSANLGSGSYDSHFKVQN